MSEPDPPASYEEIAARLEVAEQTLGAIQRGEVDGLLVRDGDELRVFTLEGADAFYRALVEQMPEGAAVVTADGRVLYANTCLADMAGVPLEQVIGADFVEFVTPTQRLKLRQLLTSEDPSDATDLTLDRPAGESVSVAVSVSPVDGYAEGARCLVVVDLTSRQAAELALREAEARFRGAFDNAPVGMALLDLHGRVEQVNPALCALAGVGSLTLVGAELPWEDSHSHGVPAALARLLKGDVAGAVVQRRGHTATGDPQWLTIHLSLLRDSAGLPRRFIAQVQDESVRRLHEEQLRHVADHDGLTGLLNRRGFEAALSQHLATAARYGGVGALLLLDVDHFKYINDTRGHYVGDQVLIQLGRTLRDRVRDSDVLARLGGDEFAVLLPHCDAGAAMQVAEELLAAARGVNVKGLVGSRHVTISVGVVQVGDVGDVDGEHLALADLAMYDAKEAGRDRARLYDRATDGQSSNGARLTWLTRIEEAIADDSLCVEAQPIFDLAAGKVAQEELLIRLPSPDGPIAAGLWFPVAERYGLAPTIDEWVVDRAFDLLDAERIPAVSVNVSATTIGRESWRDHVQDRLRRTDVDPARVTFEITETAAIANISAAVDFTEDLRARGFRLALDDFGAGFGSFYYLKHLPFDDVKIDGEFIRNCINDRRDRSIIHAMVGVASSMGRRTVAECVEDPETLNLVREQSVDLAQGYHLGRPRLVPHT